MSEFGQNSFHLDFNDTSAATAETVGKDKLKSNNWTPSNISVSGGGLAKISDATGALPVLQTFGNYGKAKAAGVRADSFSANLVLAIAMQGANEGTIFSDTSKNEKVEYLIVGGGGGGGNYYGGGGGAGGFVTGNIDLSSDNVQITVGNGGVGASSEGPGLNGENSILNNIIAYGGGAGGGNNIQGHNGGSGGGGSTSQVGGLGVPNQGNNGALPAGSTSSGGGGGAGSAASTNTPGNGLESSITGTPTYYAGGGAGGTFSNATITVAGGLGGGGGTSSSTEAENGVNGLGGGGASWTGVGSKAGNGGSGVIILRYALHQTLEFSAGVTQTTTTVNNKKVTIITAAGPTDTVKIVNNKVLTLTGPLKTSTAESKFYGSSGLFSGTSYLSASASEDFAFGTGDFTIEAWCYVNTLSGRKTIFSTASASGDSIWVGFDTGGTQPRVYTNATAGLAASAIIGTNTWAHVAFVRTSGVLKIYIDGVESGSVADTTDYTSQNCWIGYDGQLAAHPFAGYLQDLRVYKGVAKYTSAFSVPGIITGYNLDFSKDTPFAEKQEDSFELEYVVVAGGGGGSDTGGGGAGGYRSSVQGEISGGGVQAEAKLKVSVGAKNLVIIGAGGTAGGNNGLGGDGGVSVFQAISSTGGGRGSVYNSTTNYTGGSGGGGSMGRGNSGLGIAGQGFFGGFGQGFQGSPWSAGGGGGAAGPGTNGTSTTEGGNGGPGQLTYISGQPVYYAGGGGGHSHLNVNTGSQGGIGGGGNAARGNPRNQLSTAGTANTGGGGGAGDSDVGGASYNPKAGGSGIIVLRYPDHIDFEFSPGIVSTTTIVENKKVTTITAAGPTDFIVASNKKVFNNFCTWDAVANIGTELSRGNLVAELEEYTESIACGTIGVTSGKWYWEIVPLPSNTSTNQSKNNKYMVGVADLDSAINTRQYFRNAGWFYYGENGNKYTGNDTPNNTAYGSVFSANDVIGIALDMDAGSVTFYKNGVSQGVAYSGVLSGKRITPAVGTTGSFYDWAMRRRGYFGNFGQQEFIYAPPAGYKSLNTADIGVTAKKKDISSIEDILKVEYLVIAGGGAASYGGENFSGGGGAGGYRSSVVGEKSGGGADAETPLQVNLNSPYSVVVGAGGSLIANTRGGNGQDTRFSTIVSIGGGGAGRLFGKNNYSGSDNARNKSGLPGGSGGGATVEGGGGSTADGGGIFSASIGGADWGAAVGGSAILGQGFKGGDCNFSIDGVGNVGGYTSAGGGGAGGPGQDAPGNSRGGNGGSGVASKITGELIYRAGGGGGCGSVSGGIGGNGGGANGTWTTILAGPTINTGSGGGGSYYNSGSAGASGVVVLKYSPLLTLTFSAGVTQTTITRADGFKVTTITAAGPTDSVTFTSSVFDENGNFIKSSIEDELEAGQEAEDDFVALLNTPLNIFADLEKEEVAPYTDSTVSVEYLVIGGGGGGGSAGGNAGIYRSSVTGETTNGGASAEAPLSLNLNTAYPISVGLGGKGRVYEGSYVAVNRAWNDFTGLAATNGQSSVFASITALGGTAGAITTIASNGGSGASGPGTNASGSIGGNGGSGLLSNITGNPMYRAGGGGGASWYSLSGRLGGIGGGGTAQIEGGDASIWGGTRSSGQHATPNTGSGGGGALKDNNYYGCMFGGNGGSGVVILRYSKNITLKFSSGVSYKTTVVGDKKVTVVEAAGPTDTVTFKSVKPLKLKNQKISKLKNTSYDLKYLVIAGGGGGGGNYYGGGGGAGGYRCSMPGEMSGGGASAETPLPLKIRKSYLVVIGSGGASVGQTWWAGSGSRGLNGQNTIFNNIVCIGGGGGGSNLNSGAGNSGGSGGGGQSSSGLGGAGTAGQGYAGSNAGGPEFSSGGGGGAGGAGLQCLQGEPELAQPSGGPGVYSSITGVSTPRAGGGGGCPNYNYFSSKLNPRNNITTTWPYSGAGGIGGGGNSTKDQSDSEKIWFYATAGMPQTGSGGGSGALHHIGGAGGSGVVILRYSSKFILNLSEGITSETITVGDEKVTIITAAGPTDSVSFDADPEAFEDDEVVYEDEINLRIPAFYSAKFSNGVVYSEKVEGDERVYRVFSATETDTVTFTFAREEESSRDAVNVEYLVVGGGGGGANIFGGGGAGGYVESNTTVSLNAPQQITVGNGGAAGQSSSVTPVNGVNGDNSVFASITSVGGGGGGAASSGNTGGSGGGGGGWAGVYLLGSSGYFSQGFRGGSSGLGYDGSGGGGGGAGDSGENASLSSSFRKAGNGGKGKTFNITGVPVTLAGGGGGGLAYTGTPGLGGTGGGASGGVVSAVGGNAAANTGGGGGGGSYPRSAYSGGAGGSGIVILRIPATNTASFSPGVTFTTSNFGSYRVYIVTSAGPTDTVTFS